MITYYQSNLILDRAYGASTWNPPGTLYLGLSTSTINNDGTGYTEPSSGYGYARVAITNTKSYWTTAASGVLSNSATITFPQSTNSWGTITYVFIADSATLGSGNILYFDVLSPSRVVQPNTTVLLSAGAVTISMTN